MDGRNTPENWIKFLRSYGPVPKNENMYDEHIRSASKRLKVDLITFLHPAREEVLACIQAADPVSVILTGTAGDGKTHLCRQVWEELNADSGSWGSDDPYLKTTVLFNDEHGEPRTRTLHVVRDLSAWVPHKGQAWPQDRASLLIRFCESLFHSSDGEDVFLIAANDGQLVEAWNTLPEPTQAVGRTRNLLEELLVEDQKFREGVPLRLFNLSRWGSGALLRLAMEALLQHGGWAACEALKAASGEFYGPECPIRHNVDLLRRELVQRRLEALLTLCDYCGVHIPIRQIMLLLSNAILGHPDAKERLMMPKDVPGLIRDGKTAGANLYRNVFGGNLTPALREGISIYVALERFGIGQETANRLDNLLIYGAEEDNLRPYFDRYMTSDTFYGATPSFKAAQREYVEGGEEEEERGTEFLRQLIAQRQGLFFKIAEEDEEEMRLWELTVFQFAGEYLARIIVPLTIGQSVERHVVARLVRGLNRVFTGRLVVDDRELLLATDPKASFGRVSQLLEDRVSVMPRGDERVDIHYKAPFPVLRVQMGRDDDLVAVLPLHLTRYEFLVRVADGALPSSFSKECYEDILAFKSRLLGLLERRRARTGNTFESDLYFQLLDVDENGKASVSYLEVRDV